MQRVLGFQLSVLSEVRFMIDNSSCNKILANARQNIYGIALPPGNCFETSLCCHKIN